MAQDDKMTTKRAHQCTQTSQHATDRQCKLIIAAATAATAATAAWQALDAQAKKKLPDKTDRAASRSALYTHFSSQVVLVVRYAYRLSIERPHHCLPEQ